MVAARWDELVGGADSIGNLSVDEPACLPAIAIKMVGAGDH